MRFGYKRKIDKSIQGGRKVKRSLFVVLSLLLVATLVLTGCAQEAKARDGRKSH